MISKTLFFILLSVGSYTLNAQAFIGMDREDILKTMRIEKPDFRYDDNVKNERFNYLKYISDSGLETWIIVFDTEERCKAVRATCASSMLTQKRKELDALYTKEGADKWSYSYRTGSISVELKNETWYFTITYRPAPKL